MVTKLPYRAISTRVADIFIREDGILQFTFKDDIIIDAEDVVAMSGAVEELTQKVKHPMLVVTGERNGTTRASRNMSLKNTKERDYSLAEGIVINSFPTRIAANFFYKIYSPDHPYQMFKTEEEAVDWLKTFM
ncbi:MAG: hypothetical protein JKY42_10180 [Flavobacteriales bacterium]|nr:hypothetical protein [Flavobacteriales bacterium]